MRKIEFKSRREILLSLEDNALLIGGGVCFGSTIGGMFHGIPAFLAQAIVLAIGVSILAVGFWRPYHRHVARKK